MTRTFALLLALTLLALPGLGASQARTARPRVFRTTRGGPNLTVTRHVRTGVQPKSVNVSPDGTRVVVCNFGRPDRDNVFIYDSLTLAHVGTVSFIGNAVESVFTPDGNTLYVSNFRENEVEAIDFTSCIHATAEAPCTLTPRGVVHTGNLPKFMAIAPDAGTLYVANWGDRSVSVVDTATLTERRRLPTLTHPRGLILRPDGALLAAAFHGDVIHVFPQDAERESTRFPMCELPRHLLLNPDGHTMYVTCSMGFLGFYDARDGSRAGIASLGRNPRSIAMTADAHFVGAANFTSSDVSLVDTVLRTHRTYPVPGAQRIVGLAMHPASTTVRLYATSWDTNELYMLESAEIPPAAPVEAP